MSDRYLTSIKRGRGRHGVHMNINLSDQNCLTRYRSNPLSGWSDIPGQRGLLINEPIPMK